MEDDGDGDGDFTFAVAAPLAGRGVIFPGGRRIGAGRMYPVFGRPRSPPRRRAPEQEPETTTATTRLSPGRVLMVDRGRAGATQPPNGGEPAKTCYCSSCPGLSSPAAKPETRCRKSGSTGSVHRWRQRLLGRSQSDGKEKFVFLDAASPSGSERKASGGGHVTAWSYYAKAGAGAGSGNGGQRRSFLPYRQNLVGIFASATAFRRSYHPF
uniref:Uncharacterized protein n=1 Tax=Avena sativa TaxID=4498 RepID=A0ACD5T751_AVESA